MSALVWAYFYGLIFLNVSFLFRLVAYMIEDNIDNWSTGEPP